MVMKWCSKISPISAISLGKLKPQVKAKRLYATVYLDITKTQLWLWQHHNWLLDSYKNYAVPP